ncbi:MAG: hypothetical protein IT182_01265 [Acidobacteria bacterium]|nr:hypothetical protein [Acidobacteriota bacterium]
MRCLVCCVLVLLSPVRDASALNEHRALSQFGHRVWTRDQGLPQDSIRSIAQAADGALWVGTEEGLVRFDGLEFTSFGRAADGLANATISALLGSRDGAVYVGTHLGLFRYRDRQFHSFSAAGVTGRVGAIVEDRAGVVWFIEDWQLRAIRGDAVDALGVAHGITADGIRHLRLTTDGQLLVVDTKEKAFVWRGTRFEPVPPAATTREHSAIGTGTPRAWVWERDRLRGLPSSGTGDAVELTIPFPSVRAALQDRDGGLWIGTGEGLLRSVGATLERVSAPNFSAQSVVWQLFEDRDGTLWVGTNAGLHEFRDLRVAVFGSSEGFPSDQPTVVHQHVDGALWIGFENAGIVRVHDGRRDSITERDGLPADKVFSIRSSTRGDVLVATARGLARFPGGRPTGVQTEFTVDGASVFDVVEDAGDRRWMATSRGVFLADAAGTRRVLPELTAASALATTLALSPDGTLWVGTHSTGIWRYRNGAVTQFTTREGLPGNAIRALHLDDQGVLWIGSLGGGLGWWRDGTFGTLDLDDGGANVGQLVPGGDGTLWVGTSTGIVQVDRAVALTRGADAKRVVLSGAADGLRSSQCAPAFPTARGGTVDRNGRVWIITANGLVRFDPRRLHALPRPHATRLGTIAINGTPQLPTDEVVLATDVQRVTFEFSAAYLYAPERLRYHYRLDGYDTGWIDGGTRRAADYTNLPAGHYRFIVAATLGTDQAEPASIVVVQRAPWYAAAWFPVVAVGGLIAAGGLVYVGRLRRLRQRFDVILSERGRISRELHDTLAQGLVGISTQLSGVATVLRESPDVAERRLRLARRMVQHSLTEARRSIMDLRDPVLDRLSLRAAMARMAAQLTAGSPVRVSIEGDDEPADLTASGREHLLRIAQEAVHNAMKHGDPRTLTIVLQASEPVLRVEDDGRGLDPVLTDQAAEDGHFGLLGMRERARLIGRHLRIRSAPGEGTTIVVERGDD